MTEKRSNWANGGVCPNQGTTKPMVSGDAAAGGQVWVRRRRLTERWRQGASLEAVSRGR